MKVYIVLVEKYQTNTVDQGCYIAGVYTNKKDAQHEAHLTAEWYEERKVKRIIIDGDPFSGDFTADFNEDCWDVWISIEPWTVRTS